MGNFFTSTQIYDQNRLDREAFIDLFCKEMKNAGYVTCNSDESELSYILRFADNCKWVAITSEDHGEGDPAARKDTGRIAKMLKTTCINTTVIDSDCAVMEMYDQSGKKADTIVMGRADDYFGDDVPQPSEKMWKPFLAEGMTWEQLCNILNNSEGYTFVEDCLSEFAPVIGMDDSNILFSAEDAIEGDEQTVFLNFKKVSAKKEKKLTLNAAFIRIFGEALEPLGFVKIKSKHPYFVRVVNGEILHVITFQKDSYKKNRFDVYAGIATIYRQLLDFDQDLGFNTKWMSPIGVFEDYKVDNPVLGVYYEYDLNNQATMIGTLSTALEHTKQFILPVLEKVSDLQKVIEYYAIYNSVALFIYSAKDMPEYNRDDNEGFLYIKINDHSDLKAEYEKGLEREKFMIKKGRSNFDLNKLIETSEKSRKEKIMNRDAIYNNQELHNRVLHELSSNSTLNLNRLQKYGLPIDK